jgi:hypothetical protein
LRRQRVAHTFLALEFLIKEERVMTD